MKRKTNDPENQILNPQTARVNPKTTFIKKEISKNKTVEKKKNTNNR